MNATESLPVRITNHSRQHQYGSNEGGGAEGSCVSRSRWGSGVVRIENGRTVDLSWTGLEVGEGRAAFFAFMNSAITHRSLIAYF
jgi:hypothetical protein